MLVNKIAKATLLQTRILMKFGGGHHHHVYDWRDDPKQNTDIYHDPRAVGIQKAEQYTFPYTTQRKLDFVKSHPEGYNQKDLSTNVVGAAQHPYQNPVDIPVMNYMSDLAHEFDYESEDLDFQPQTFNYQHFRKQGPIWMWIFACTAPLWVFASDLYLQYWPDADNWRYQRPPPYNYPDDAQTPDDEYLQMFKSKGHRLLYDSGVVNPPFFEIIDGKKVYSKWAGVNQPRSPI